ncbi:Flagellar protein fliL [Borrelia parkeri SLO]|uniref:Flagellar protein FliL n=1 Tax=Borrelia parkeri SLO TaxID=1313294 RepID=A0ABM5PKE5_BORPR|nr:flagellar basal body-associated protein FliL [Borrelia parkeri]AHH09654.1 Flagellar protein fliL [Borrelia parkeri SLO]UPA10458.1 flagellar basal body-associated FliL family protein [Borrelia parkeri]
MPERDDGSIDVGGADNKRMGLLPDVIIKILQILAIGLFTVVIMIIVAYFVSKMVVSQSGAPNNFPIFSNEYLGKPPMLIWYESIDEIRGTTQDTPPKTFVIKLALGYAENNVNILSELGRQKVRLKDIIREYFSQRTGQEIKNESQIKAEIKARINSILRNGEIKEIALTQIDIFDM